MGGGINNGLQSETSHMPKFRRSFNKNSNPVLSNENNNDCNIRNIIHRHTAIKREDQECNTWRGNIDAIGRHVEYRPRLNDIENELLEIRTKNGHQRERYPTTWDTCRRRIS